MDDIFRYVHRWLKELFVVVVVVDFGVDVEVVVR